MIYVVIGFLWLSICLYLIFGGSDFGAGIIELMTNKKDRSKIQGVMYESMAPVWEANHMWLIIAIVIMFVGFPVVYATLSISLHIPFVLMLVGIIARGTAFTFLHYDAVEDKWQKLYTQIFYYSSLLTPFFLGVIAASTISHKLIADQAPFLDKYIFSWLNWFGVSVGLFTISICAYLASIFALRETKNDDELAILVRKAKKTMAYIVISGALVFLNAYLEKIPLFTLVFSGSIGIVAILLATAALGAIFYCMKRRLLGPVRFLAGFQVVMILVAATYTNNTNIVFLSNGNHLSLLEHMAPAKTIDALGWALVLGSIFILPFLFYLLYSFTKRSK